MQSKSTLVPSRVSPEATEPGLFFFVLVWFYCLASVLDCLCTVVIFI